MNYQIKQFIAEALAELGFPRWLVGKLAGLTPRQVHIAIEREKMSKRLWWSILKRDNFTCRYCGRSAPEVTLHVDHVVALANGGRTVIDNLVTACASCNMGKGTDTVNL